MAKSNQGKYIIKPTEKPRIGKPPITDKGIIGSGDLVKRQPPRRGGDIVGDKIDTPLNDRQKVEILQQRLESFQSEFYKGNFTGSQDFTKYVRFNSKIKLPVVASLPATCELGEAKVLSSNGKLYICSAANTWTAQT